MDVINSTMFPDGYNDRIEYTNFYSRKHYVEQPLNDPEQRIQLDSMRVTQRSFFGIDHVCFYIRSTKNYSLIDMNTYPLALGPKKSVEKLLEWFKLKNPRVFNSGNFIICHE